MKTLTAIIAATFTVAELINYAPATVLNVAGLIIAAGIITGLIIAARRIVNGIS